MFALLSEEDMEFILETQIPQVEAVDAKKRSLAKTFTGGGKKKVAEALAAIPKLPEPSSADLAHFTASARSCTSQRTSSHEDYSCIARSASLLGCKFALLWHPGELETNCNMGLQCMDHMHTELQMPRLSAMWAAWIMCHGGTVVASTAVGSASSDVPHATSSGLASGDGRGGESGPAAGLCRFPGHVTREASGSLPFVFTCAIHFSLVTCILLCYVLVLKPSLAVVFGSRCLLFAKA